ncbi:hypothetical protein [Leucobacter sp.]
MVTSSWCGFAALGSGLILCAVAAGTDPLLAVPLVALAVLELLWGGIALRVGRVPAPRAMLAVGAGVVAVATVLLFTGLVGIVPLLALLVLHWTAAVLAVLSLRRGRDRSPGTGPRGPAGGGAGGRASRPAALVVILTAQAMLVAAITTPALAHTAPGESAVPHGTLHEPHAH